MILPATGTLSIFQITSTFTAESSAFAWQNDLFFYRGTFVQDAFAASRFLPSGTISIFNFYGIGPVNSGGGGGK